jgi:hypothetical protein
MKTKLIVALVRNTRKTVAVSSAPPKAWRSSFSVWRRAAAPFGFLTNTRKTVAVSSAPPKAWRSSFSVWRRAAAPFALLSSLAGAADLKLGIIGTDTSHATAFAKLLNDPLASDHIGGAKIVAAYKGGSPDIEESASRVDGYAAEIQKKWNVKLVASIGELCPLVDGILLESVDGRPHLAQFREAAKCGKPVFIDKPLAATFEDALAIADLAARAHIHWFSASALRFSEVEDMKNADVTGAMVWAPGPTEPHHQLDLTWYGIHGVEMLYTILGPGCVEVSRLSSASEDVLTGRWADGRLGVVHLERPYGKYGAIAFVKGQKIDARPDVRVSYIPLVKKIVEFMHTGKAPVPNEETMEMFAFMDAGQKSLHQNSAAVKLVP